VHIPKKLFLNMADNKNNMLHEYIQGHAMLGIVATHISLKLK
jgi:hypothetical protein